MRKLILLFLIVCPLWLTTLTSAANTPEKAAKIDGLMSQYVDCCAFTGSVLVSDHDRIIFKKGFGLANREWNIPNAPDVKFRIGSITKQFTSMLVIQQFAKGTIKLDARLSDYLAYYRKDTGSKVTISQLLSHLPESPVTPTIPNSSKTFRATTMPSTIS